MPLICATCNTYVCRLGRRDLGPDSCPMREDFPGLEMYEGEALRLAREASLIEARGYRRWTRTQEVVELASRLGVGTVGLAYCPDMEPEAHAYAHFLEEHGLRVVVPEPPDGAGGCHPLEQASGLNAAGAGLNVIVGMCVGHDALFTRASRARVVALVARDTFLQHNPVAALYGSRGYFRTALYRAHRSARQSVGEGTGLLRQAAHDPFGEAGRALAALASDVAREGKGRWCRVEELLEFAARAGARKVGLVFCHGLREEAKVLERVLRVNDFRVASVGCKAGAYPKELIGIADHEKVRPGSNEMTCNPLAQAELLNREETDLNILMGQCAGHDTATMGRSQALTVYLVVKDRVLAHNTAAAIYRRVVGGPV